MALTCAKWLPREEGLRKRSPRRSSWEPMWTKRCKLRWKKSLGWNRLLPISLARILISSNKWILLTSLKKQVKSSRIKMEITSSLNKEKNETQVSKVWLNLAVLFDWELRIFNFEMLRLGSLLNMYLLLFRSIFNWILNFFINTSRYTFSFQIYSNFLMIYWKTVLLLFNLWCPFLI